MAKHLNPDEEIHSIYAEYDAVMALPEKWTGPYPAAWFLNESFSRARHRGSIVKSAQAMYYWYQGRE